MKNRDISTAIVPRKPLAKQSRGQSERKPERRSPQKACPHCQSTNLTIGAGKKPGEESCRCGDCNHFLGYSPLARLRKARKRKDLTKCLEILESQGLRGELALFSLSLADEFSNQGKSAGAADLVRVEGEG